MYIEGENRYSARQKQIRLRSVKAAIAGACIVYAISILLIRLTAEKFLLYMDFAESEVIADSDSCFPGNEFQERGEAEEVNPERKERFTRTANFRSACLMEEENKSVD